MIRIVKNRKILYLVADDYLFWQFRLNLARAARDAGAHVSVASAPGELESQLNAEGFRFFPLKLRRKSRNPFSEIVAVLDLVLLYRTVKPDLVHQVAIKPVLYGSLAAKIAGVQSVVNAITGLGYVFMADGWKARLLRKCVEWAYRICLSGRRTRVLFENPDDREFFVKGDLVKPSKTVLIPGAGVDPDRFSPRQEPAGEIMVLLTARMLWDKGIGELVEAAKILKERNVPGKVILAGRPDENNPAAITEKQLLDWNEKGVVQWIGHQTDMPSLLAKSHIACLPSYAEGLPVSLLEAASCAKPIVATDVAGCREIVKNGVNGFLVPLKDSHALAASLEKLILDSKLRKTMGEKGRELVLRNFTDDLVIKSIFSVYRSLL